MKIVARIEPIEKKFDAGEHLSPQEIEAIAAYPEVRQMLFTMLRQRERTELFPAKYSTSIAQGEAALAYWMMHPHQLQDAPEIIEFIETMKRPVNGQEAEFHVYRYKMPADHWASKNGWILGLAGPIKVSAEPYTDMPEVFSRASDSVGKVKPSELVDRYVGILR